MRHLILIFTFFLILGNAFPQTKTKIPYGNNLKTGHYKNVNGIKIYYESYGSGQPLLLLHGNGGSIKSSAGKIEFFQKKYRVIAIDSRAHGNSTDTKQPLTYVQMANDIKVLLDSLRIDSAYIWGQSDGGILGLLMAIHYPGKVAKLATFGANIFPGKEAIFDEVDDLVLDTLKTTKNAHTKKLYGLMAYQPNITVTELQKIKCPVLVMTADGDIIRLEHSIKIFNAIEKSNLFVMPGAAHGGSWQKPELFNRVLSDFLDRPLVKFQALKQLYPVK